jgi:hypothetical protein
MVTAEQRAAAACLNPRVIQTAIRERSDRVGELQSARRACAWVGASPAQHLARDHARSSPSFFSNQQTVPKQRLARSKPSAPNGTVNSIGEQVMWPATRGHERPLEATGGPGLTSFVRAARPACPSSVAVRQLSRLEPGTTVALESDRSGR